MSGLFAVWNRDQEPVAEGLLRRVARELEARGGGSPSVWRHGETALIGAGFRHASRRVQPVGDANGEVHIVTDARIDNRNELLRELNLSSKTGAWGDGELIVAAYRKWGREFARRLRGDFAVVLWDRKADRLLLARDSFGVKPLHFHVSDRLVCVASEGRDVLMHPRVPDEIDRVFVGRCLLDIHGDQGDQEISPFSAVRRLAPGHLLEVHREGFESQRFWRPEDVDSIHLENDAELGERFRELFDRAVASRTRDCGSVVGVQLSGGLDSTSVAATSAAVGARAGGFEVVGMTAGFPPGSPADEDRYLKLLAAATGIEIEHFDAVGETLIDRDASGCVDPESPFVGWAVERRMLRTLADRGGRVMLTGHGGDSVCFGSPLVYADLFRAGRFRRLIGDLKEHAQRRGVGLWPLVRRYIVRPILPERFNRVGRRLAGKRSEAAVPNWLSRDYACRYELDRMLAGSKSPHHGGRTALESLRFNALHLGVVGESVFWLDRLADRYGIEVRHPFLDVDLVEFLLAVEPERLFRAGWGKLLLREAMTGRLPEAICRRFDKASTGFFWRDRLRGAEWAEVEAVLGSPLLLEMGLLEPREFSRELARFRAGRPSSLDGPLWRILCVELWLRRTARRRSMICR